MAVPLVARWRRQHEACAIVLDQFEELFTQNPPAVQASFAELLARLALEADVQVLLSLRDDFLFHCAELPPLAPVFSDVTPLKPPTGAALRRALVQPALKCGYRFEDEAIVEELLAQVAGERGALPLVAFAMARLWDERDRDRGLLTRAAYTAIGGVGGALAQHAEATLDRIGAARLPIVRELCRNLVTAAGTRAAVVRDDLLSVFPVEQREAAGAVLETLIDARLLTSYEDPRGDTTTTAHHRVEFVHESLLAHWPRLVRWQAQDAEGAVLRDQLRQAAHLWDEHGRADDLLWTGTVYREFQVWRERYSGALTAIEETFTAAMHARARRTYRRRRLAVAAVLVLALGGVGITSALWRRSEQARGVAATEAARAEASKLLALGQVELDRDPAKALAYTLASLEIADTPIARRFAVEVLWHGPPARVVKPPASADFLLMDLSDDARWLALSGQGPDAFVWSRSGGPPVRLGGHEDSDHVVQFAPGGETLVTLTPRRLRIWNAPTWRQTNEIALDRPADFLFAGRRILTLAARQAPGGGKTVDAWSVEGTHVEGPAHWPATWADGLLALDRAGTTIVSASGPTVAARTLKGVTPGLQRIIGRHVTAVTMLAVSAGGGRIASSDGTGEVRVWDAQALTTVPVKTFAAGLAGRPGEVMEFDATGGRLATRGSRDKGPLVWDLAAPTGSQPLTLRSISMSAALLWGLRFSSDGRWLAGIDDPYGVLWPVLDKYPRVIRAPTMVLGIEFDPRGRWLAVASSEGVRLWPLPGNHGESIKVFGPGSGICCGLAATPDGNRLLIADEGRVWSVPTAGGPPRQLPMPDGDMGGYMHVAVSGDGRLAAAGGGAALHNAVIPVWDLASETLVKEFRPKADPSGPFGMYSENVIGIAFTPDGRLVTSGQAGVRLWDLEHDHGTLLLENHGQEWTSFLSASRGGTIAVLRSPEGTQSGSVWTCAVASCTWREVVGHGAPTSGMTLDRSGATLVSATTDGLVRVGRVSGGDPALAAIWSMDWLVFSRSRWARASRWVSSHW